MVVQDDVDTGAVSEVEDVVEALHEVRVEGVAIGGLGAGPDDAEADGVVAEGLDVVDVGLVEGVAGSVLVSGGVRGVSCVW